MEYIFDIYMQLHALVFDAGRIPAAIAALVLTMVAGMVTGPFAGNANPFFWSVIDTLFGRIGDRLDRLQRGRADLMFRGFVLMVFALVFSLAAGEFFARSPFLIMGAEVGQVLVLSLLISSGAVWFSLLKLYFSIEKEELIKGSYYNVSRSTRANLNTTDDFGIIRTAMGYGAKAFDKGVVSPIFWYLVGGLTGVFAYSCLSALVWRFGKSGFTKGFGVVPLALEKLLGFVPGLLAAFLITVAGIFTPTAKPHKGALSWLARVPGRAPYDEGGYPVTALAWTLNVSLGGPVQDLGGSVIKKGWVGPDGATAQLGHHHLKRCIYISFIGHMLFICSLLGAYIPFLIY